MLRTVAGVGALALALAAVALAAPEKSAYNLTANLRARSEVPKPTGVPTKAVGLFTGKAVELKGDQARITWRLTFSHLTGAAVAAHIHAGRPGVAGPVLLALCGPCTNGQKGTGTITHAQLATIASGGAYVNVHTAKNAPGEIRGQVKASESG